MEMYFASNVKHKVESSLRMPESTGLFGEFGLEYSSHTYLGYSTSLLDNMAFHPGRVQSN